MNNTSLLYWGKILYSEVSQNIPCMVLKCPHPLEVQHTPYQIPQWEDPQPHFCTESLRAEIWDPVPTIPSLAQPSSCTKGLWAVMPGFCHQFVGTYWHPWLPSTWLPLLGCRLEVSATSPQFPFEGVLRHSQALSPTLTSKTFDPIAVMSLMIISIVALTPDIMLISITIPYTSLLLGVTGFHSLWPLPHHL